jgi:hypothetical protein
MHTRHRRGGGGGGVREQELRNVFDFGLYDAPLREGLPAAQVKGVLDTAAGAGYAAIQMARRFPVCVNPHPPLLEPPLPL